MVYYKGQDAGNSTDGLFIPLTQQFLWETAQHAS